MAAADLYAWLIEATIAGSAAIFAVLALRRPLRALFGAGACHAAWSAVPIALLATLLPAGEAAAPLAPLAAIRAPIRVLAESAPVQASPDIAMLACIAWCCGCLAFAGHFALRQRRFMRRLGGIALRGDDVWLADAVAGLPAVVGVWKPRIVLPADALTRYDAEERALMLAHEREHIVRGDLPANALVAVLRCLFWFNPLLHVAARRFRYDQELACDARVIARHPHSRRAYGEAMLKTQMSAERLPLGCHWGQSHPLKERIEMLKRPLPSSMRRTGGRAVVIAILLASGYAAWATQPHAPPASAPAGEIVADMVLRIDDGKPVGMRVLTRPGQAFSIRSDEAGKHYAIEGTVARVRYKEQPALSLDMRISEGGKQVATPRIVVGNGKTGSIQTGDETRDAAGRIAFKGIRLDITLTDSAVQPVAVASLSTPPPAYPVDVSKQGVTGRVVLVVDVAVDGSVAAAKVERSAGDERLDAAAREAVWKWRFAPKLKNGKPVPSQVRVPIDFEMDRNHEAPVAQARAALARRATARLPDAPGWGSYGSLARSFSASWETPAAPADDC